MLLSVKDTCGDAVGMRVVCAFCSDSAVVALLRVHYGEGGLRIFATELANEHM